LPEGEGFVKVAYTQDRLVGGVAVEPYAADVLAPLALAIQVDASLDDLTVVYVAHLTVSELASIAACSV
jgi:dihydrolipoamide dehydrogenase